MIRNIFSLTFINWREKGKFCQMNKIEDEHRTCLCWCIIFHFSYDLVLKKDSVSNRFSVKSFSVFAPSQMFTTSPDPLLFLLHRVLHLYKTSSVKIPIVNASKLAFFKVQLQFNDSVQNYWLKKVFTPVSASSSSTPSAPSCQFGQLWVDNLKIQDWIDNLNI